MPASWPWNQVLHTRCCTRSCAKENPRFNIYTPVQADRRTSTHLSDKQKAMIRQTDRSRSEITDQIFWQQVWGDKDALLDSIDRPGKTRQFAIINYGPWDRLASDQCHFIEQYGPRPPGARFYPEDMSREEFEAWEQEGKDKGSTRWSGATRTVNLKLVPVQPGLSFKEIRQNRRQIERSGRTGRGHRIRQLPSDCGRRP